jgi:IS66 Orf2 like protein
MKEADRTHIERCLEQIDTWRASGMKLKAYAQSRDEELSHGRVRLSWEKRWCQALTAVPVGAFVRAVPVRHTSASKTQRTASTVADHTKGKEACVRVVVSREGSALRAYAFANLRANRMKVLLHDAFGLWLCSRRLHRRSRVRRRVATSGPMPLGRMKALTRWCTRSSQVAVVSMPGTSCSLSLQGRPSSRHRMFTLHPQSGERR